MNVSADPAVLDTDAAWIDSSGTEVLRATGADRVSFLHRLVTGNVQGAGAGHGCRALLLTVKAEIVSDMTVLVGGDDVWLLVAAGQGDTTAAALGRYAVMDDFVCARAADLAVAGVFGPRALERLASAGVELSASLASAAPFTHVQAGDLRVVRARACGADGVWLVAAPVALAAVARRLGEAGVSQLNDAVAEARRIAAGEPRWGREITPDYFPMEIGLSSAIDYGKGCFLGQEPIVRVRDRGHLNWRLARLRLAGDAEVPPPQAAIESDARPRAGHVTSAALLPHTTGPEGVALAAIHSSIPDGSDVRIKLGDGRSVPARVIGTV